MTSNRALMGLRRCASFASHLWLAAFAAAVWLAMIAGAAHAETRVLKIYHLHTHEKAEIAFWKDGRYLPDGLKKLDWILRDWRENKQTDMDPRLFTLLWEVYRRSGSSGYIDVVCGYRSPETNSMLRRRTRGVAEKSQHILGKAIDFFIPDVPLEKLREIAFKVEGGGVGYYPSSGSPFVHLDVGPVRSWPRMSRQRLLALFPSGKTLYIPADGQPLPGYEEALAEYKARKGVAADVQLASARPSAGRFGHFLTRLFGGADEAEDNAEAAEATVTPSSAPAHAKGLPGVLLDGPQLPARAAKPPQAIAVLPPDEAPVPFSPASADAEVQPVVLAATAPIPTRRPDMARSVQIATGEKLLLPGGTVAPRRADEVADMLARLSDEARKDRAGKDEAALAARSGEPLLAAFARPTPVLDGRRSPVILAALDKRAPQPIDGGVAEKISARPAIFTVNDDDGRGGRVTPGADRATPRLALLANPGVDPERALDAGVRTTPRNARHAGPAAPRPGAVAMPIASDVARWAVNPKSFEQPLASAARRSLAYNIVRTPPRMVYTAGFQKGALDASADRFSGAAVKFLPVAHFGGD